VGDRLKLSPFEVTRDLLEEFSRCQDSSRTRGSVASSSCQTRHRSVTRGLPRP
jgi:hypothetical protein